MTLQKIWRRCKWIWWKLFVIVSKKRWVQPTSVLQQDFNKNFPFSLQIQKGFESHTNTINESVLSAVHSQAHTPAPTLYDVQEQIKQHLAQGQINTAFHHALVANDLNLVEFTLEKADYKQVFNPCPLQQPVLLSLIQQIAADMNNHNDLKQRYLSDAIVSLDMNDATTREHAPKITRELYQHCQNFIATNQHSPLVGGVKMLMMAVQGLKMAWYRAGRFE